jgi:polyribonucleotide nucleotidyltransferase
VRIENVDDVIKVGDKIQVEIREVDDRGKLSLVPVEVVEREAAGEDLGGGGGDRGDRGDRGGDRGDRNRDRDRGSRGDRGRSGDRQGGEHYRTRHRDRESGNS